MLTGNRISKRKTKNKKKRNKMIYRNKYDMSRLGFIYMYTLYTISVARSNIIL